MSVILNKVRDIDPNNNEAVKEALSTFFQNITKHTGGDCNRWLRALESVINRFPKYCLSHRTVIEAYLVSFLDCSTYHNIVLAGKCAHALQQVRPCQEKTATPKTSWRDQLNTLCQAAHALIGAVFPHAVDIHQQTGNKQEEPVTNSLLTAALFDITSTATTDNNQNKHGLLSTRLRNVFVFIQAMLVEIYPVAKPIRPQIVLDVILRALSVSSGTKAAKDHNWSDVVAVKTQALRSLDALVACLGSNLIPFSPLLFRIVMQTLKWTADNPSEESRKVRVTAYNSLRIWLTTLHVHRLSDGGRWEDELTNHLIDDITPHRHVIQLNVNAQQPTKNLSKKAKKKLANSMLLQSNMSSHMPGDKGKTSVNEKANEEVTLAALDCTETFLTVCGLFLKPSTHKMFQERLIRECYNYESASAEHALGIFRAVEACRKSVPPSVPPPTQLCLQLYSAALSSAYQDVTNFCSRALLDIRLHLHCSPPSINFAIEVQDEMQVEKEEKKKKVSDRNRVVLEGLLGKDRMPDQEDDVISIPDEPSRKKPRMEEEEDEQISLSSESLESEDSSDAEIVEHDAEVEATDNVDGPPHITKHDVQMQTVENTTQLGELFNEGNAANIHEVNTQMPQHVIATNEIDRNKSPDSMEVIYDYPNTAKNTVAVLETISGDNLPSTNETDDIQITCGQVIKSLEKPEEMESEVRLTQEIDINTEPKLNGIGNSVENSVQNGNLNDDGETDKIVVNGEKVTVEDMLADFVDEVLEDTTQTTQV